jgi:hypothetical protein
MKVGDEMNLEEQLRDDLQRMPAGVALAPPPDLAGTVMGELSVQRRRRRAYTVVAAATVAVALAVSVPVGLQARGGPGTGPSGPGGEAVTTAGYPAPDPVTVDIRIPGGTVELSAAPREEATVEVAPDDDRSVSREAAERTRVTFSDGTLVVAAPQGRNLPEPAAPQLRVSVQLPTGSSARLQVADAGVTGQGEWSDVQLTTVSGDIALEHVTGDLTVNTAAGDVSVERVDGSVVVQSAGGDVRLDQVGADVDVQTAAGDVEIAAARRGAVRADTAAGDVTVGVVAGTGVSLDLGTLAGAIRSDPGMDGGPGQELTVWARTLAGDIEVHWVPD